DARTAFSVLYNQGDGTLGRPAYIAQGPITEGLAVGDVNGDGWLDIVVASSPMFVYLNRGGRMFAQEETLNVTALSVTLADINRDGKPDVVAGLGFGIAVFLNQRPDCR